MEELFEMFAMMANYEERKVKNDECENFTLDTCKVYDRAWTYETAVAHEDFNNGKWIILEGTNTKESALEAHERWLEKLKSGVDLLEDCYNKKIYKREV